jgi:hypothetical protein
MGVLSSFPLLLLIEGMHKCPSTCQRADRVMLCHCSHLIFFNGASNIRFVSIVSVVAHVSILWSTV